jgi:hypothetical protein
VAREWREAVRYFELEKIPIRLRHPESNGTMERYHTIVREDTFGNREVEGFNQGRQLLA